MNRGTWQAIQSVGLQRVILTERLTLILEANKWEDYSNYFTEGMEICRNWAAARFLTFMVGLGPILCLQVVF